MQPLGRVSLISLRVYQRGDVVEVVSWVRPLWRSKLIPKLELELLVKLGNSSRPQVSTT